MDEGKIVLVCPGSGSGRDRLIANFVVFDALHAAKSRADLSPELRRWFSIWLDEVQIYDGASSGTLAALLEQVAKYAVRALLLNQNPERLTAATRDAVTHQPLPPGDDGAQLQRRSATSAATGLLTPDGYDGRTPLYRRRTLDEYVTRAGDGGDRGRPYALGTAPRPCNVLSDNCKWGGTADTARPRLTRS